MIQGMWPSKKAKYDADKLSKKLDKAKQSTRTPEEVVNELDQCSSTIGQKHHQIECLKYELQQFTIKMNELLLELKSAREAHQDQSVTEPINVVP